MAGLLVLGLAAWVLAPTGSDSTRTVAATTGAAGTEAAAAGPGAAAGTATSEAAGASASSSSGPATVPGAAAATGGRQPGAAASTSTGGACPPGGPGTTDKTISIAVSLLDLAGPIGNGAAGQASADDSQKMAQAVIADINGRGGVACRTLSAKYYKLNPIGADQGRSGCIQILQDKPALVVDLGGFAFPQGAYLCIPQQRVPILTNSTVLAAEVKKFLPYLASGGLGELATVARDTVFGLRERGFFDPAKGFKKLGLLVDQCSPGTNQAFDAALAKAGVTAAQISKYEFACPANGFPSPTDMAAAVGQHQRDGVTHVIPITGGGASKTYSEAANSQLFHPRYAVSDYQGNTVTATSNLHPNADNFDGALAMTTGTFGMDTTPGVALDPGTKRCQGIAVKAGFPPDQVFKGAGSVCSLLWTAQAAFGHARSLTPTAILPGLFDAGTIQAAYSNADVTFRAPDKLYAGDTWTPVEWHKNCLCWFQLERTRRPSFPE
jgi:hypothetical protein